MDYFSILNLEREPFSNSPDPAYFYHSRLHVDCLQKLELSIRLHRGLNVVIGAVGTLLGGGAGVVICTLLARYKFIELPKDVYYVTTLPVRLAVGDVAVIALAALVICFLATLYPARQAARLDPVEAIRYG